jgi:hypothetical protein
MDKLKIEDLKKELYCGDFGECFRDYDNGYICDIITEIADNNIPIYNGDLWETAKEYQDEIEEALREFGTPTDSNGNIDLMRIFQQGIYLFNERNLYENLEESLQFFMYDYIEKELKIQELTEEQNDDLLDWDFSDNNEQLENLIEHIENILIK